MTQIPAPENVALVIERPDLQHLLDALARRGFEVIGPTARDGAIIYDTVERVTELPAGWTEVQEAGQYRLERRKDEALFGFAVGPHAWKRLLHPPRTRLWGARRDADGFSIQAGTAPPPRYAFLGVRSCDLHAIAVQDRVFLQGPYVDPIYQGRREQAFIVAVQCTVAGGTCFCVSMNTGPRAEEGFDLALTERIDGSSHRFLVEVGSDRGLEVMAEVPHRTATAADLEAALEASARTAAQMGRQLETEGLPALLTRNYEHPRWTDVASRCLTCANCTMVCPTCFCTTVEDVTDLTGQHAERWRRWDSCFTMDFSYIHGGSVRQTPLSRYRQWMTHKLATWHDQFGTSGCVGCGRCITWCPVGIDITVEAAAIRETDPGGPGVSSSEAPASCTPSRREAPNDRSGE